MDPLMATELFRHLDYDALGKPAGRTRTTHRPHLMSRLRNGRRRPRDQ
jgi:hypothetical protein